ncbi:DUF6233 domain-containing protein [Streptomyces sp. SAJ15]|uniref:DUF6233 domain-containing protein n=1 Tax=Streptomyces sp. SAJ15 TaxID=2011095 RepID=UPI001C910B43
MPRHPPAPQPTSSSSTATNACTNGNPTPTHPCGGNNRPRLRRPSRPSESPAPVETDAERWSVEEPRRPRDAPPRTIVHHSSCFTIQGPAELTTAQAARALRRPGAKACPACGADRLAAH